MKNMTKFILHGGYTGESNEQNESFYKTIAESIPKNGKVLFIYFANTDGIEEKFEEDKNRINSYLGDNFVSFVLAESSLLSKQLVESDVIYIRGGDTNLLKAELEKTPNFKDLLYGKTVAGSSAGAYVLSSLYYSNSKDAVLSGFGCLPIRCACHFESNKHPNVKGKDPVAKLNEYDNNLELVLLRDSEWRVFLD